MRERAAVNKGGTAFMTPFADRKDCRGCFFMRWPALWNYVADATCGPRGEQGGDHPLLDCVVRLAAYVCDERHPVRKP